MTLEYTDKPPNRDEKVNDDGCGWGIMTFRSDGKQISGPSLEEVARATRIIKRGEKFFRIEDGIERPYPPSSMKTWAVRTLTDKELAARKKLK